MNCPAALSAEKTKTRRGSGDLITDQSEVGPPPPLRQEQARLASVCLLREVCNTLRLYRLPTSENFGTTLAIQLL